MLRAERRGERRDARPRSAEKSESRRGSRGLYRRHEPRTRRGQKSGRIGPQPVPGLVGDQAAAPGRVAAALLERHAGERRAERRRARAAAPLHRPRGSPLAIDHDRGSTRVLGAARSRRTARPVGVALVKAVPPASLTGTSSWKRIALRSVHGASATKKPRARSRQMPAGAKRPPAVEEGSGEKGHERERGRTGSGRPGRARPRADREVRGRRSAAANSRNPRRGGRTTKSGSLWTSVESRTRRGKEGRREARWRGRRGGCRKIRAESAASRTATAAPRSALATLPAATRSGWPQRHGGHEGRDTQAAGRRRGRFASGSGRVSTSYFAAKR